MTERTRVPGRFVHLRCTTSGGVQSHVPWGISVVGALTHRREGVYARCTSVSASQGEDAWARSGLLIRNGFVVSMDPDVGDIPNGDVLVEDGVIVEVGRGLEVSEAEVIDATGMIVMPGFVDTHRHTWQTPVRGVLPCCTLDNYFAVMLGSVGGHYRPEDVRIGNYAGALEALNGGVTTLLDWSHINNTPDHSDAAIQGLKEPGSARSTRMGCRRVANGGRSATSTTPRTSGASATRTSRPTTA